MFRWERLAGFALLLPVSPLVRAANISFTGTFLSDTDLQFFTFTVLNPTPGVALRTWSYSGGVNAAGQAIPSGGFEPYLNMYMADGTQMNPGFSGPCTAGGPGSDLLPDPTTARAAMFTIPPLFLSQAESGAQVLTPWFFRPSPTLESAICRVDFSPRKCSACRAPAISLARSAHPVTKEIRRR